MSSRRRRQKVDTRTVKKTDEKKKKEKDPELVALEAQQKALRKAFHEHYRGRETAIQLGPKAKIFFTYKDESGRNVQSEEMTKREYNVLFTKLLDAQKDLFKRALALSGKQSDRNTKDRIVVSNLKANFIEVFDELLAMMPKDVREAYLELAVGDDRPVSKKLLNHMVRYYVYDNELYKGAGEVTASGKDNKGQFRIDKTLSDVLSFKGDNEEGQVIRQIMIGSRIKHLMEEEIPEQWELQERSKEDKDRPDDETNRLKRYNKHSVEFRTEWESQKNKKQRYLDTIELDAARRTLEEEGIKLAGKPRDVIEDESLRMKDPALSMIASVDYVAELINNKIDIIKANEQ